MKLSLRFVKRKHIQIHWVSKHTFIFSSNKPHASLFLKLDALEFIMVVSMLPSLTKMFSLLIPENYYYYYLSNFKRFQALKYYVTRYNNGRWITLNDLKSIRNVGWIELKSTIFDCSDVNQFLNYWVNCEEDMLELLELKLKEGAIIDKDVLTDQLITVHVEGASSTDFFM